ncbi:MAG: diphosphomevalonate decarboxylase [Candidatus Bathyarchaeia archaeon]|jgi:diphosphomevalonate decarboxylase
MKVTAKAHPIQGLIKYHGLKDPRQRIPYHDSISVCIQALTTTTTVETLKESKKDQITINGKQPNVVEKKRVETVLDKLKELAEYSGSFKVVSQNSLEFGKGLGFSASGFAALGLAAAEALSLGLDSLTLSEIVRLGAGSATRSIVGGFAIWYANRGGRSYAEQLETSKNMDFSMVIVPVRSDVKTDEAHAEVLSSCLFKARLENINDLLKRMKKAISLGDTPKIGTLAEEDTLNLHAITMTGKSHMVLWEPDTVRVIKEVIRMREEGLQAWYSMDTGPSVFVNTYKKNAGRIAERFNEIGFKNVQLSNVGEKPFLIGNHLF